MFPFVSAAAGGKRGFEGGDYEEVVHPRLRQHIENTLNISKLADCPLTTRLHFDEGKKCVVYTERPGSKITCRGILDALKVTFYPQYEFFDAKNCWKKRRPKNGRRFRTP